MIRYTIGLILTAAVAFAARGGDHCPPCTKKVVCYQDVPRTVCVEVPYEKTVTKYDHCGKPYCVTVTCTKTVESVVVRRVRVAKLVTCD